MESCKIVPYLRYSNLIINANKMVLSKKAITKINTIEIRLKLGLAFNVTEQAIIRYITNNEKDGPLTRATALRLIQTETGLTESEILVDSKITA